MKTAPEDPHENAFSEAHEKYGVATEIASESG